MGHGVIGATAILSRNIEKGAGHRHISAIFLCQQCDRVTQTAGVVSIKSGNRISTRDHILATYVPTHIPPEVDAEIRAKFPIRLMTEDLVESA